MQRFFHSVLIGFVGLLLGTYTPAIVHAQKPAIAASLDLGGDTRRPEAADEVPDADGSYPTKVPLPEVAVEPVISNSKRVNTVNWTGLTKDSLAFLTVMQGFRLAMEHGTRAALGNPFFKGYVHALQNMHGFGDGDPFYVNYIGHPMQGAAAGFIWANNDRAYKDVYFGSDRRYWKEKLRGAAFSYVYSVQFEIGPVSEASIGDMQSYYPAQGFVDHVVTPAIGMGWSIGEDAVDRYFIRRIERKTGSRVLKILARSLLNPSHSFANLMGKRYPWDRTNRPIPSAANSADYYKPVPVREEVSPPVGVAPFEFRAESVIKSYFGNRSFGSCIGGGAGLGLRVASEWQIAADVNGCKMTDLPTNVSGDSLTYVIGPRWSSQISSRWITHAQFLVGGNKVTQELVFPDKKKEAEQSTKELAKHGIKVWPPPYAEFARSWDSNAFAIVTGAGVDLKFTNALLLRTALGYSRSWNPDINDISYRNSLQFSSGLVLNMGTW